MISAQRTINLYEQNPPKHRRRSSRMSGTNPRATGTNPRAIGTNPRAEANREEERQKLTKERNQLYKRRALRQYESEEDRQKLEADIKKIENKLKATEVHEIEGVGGEYGASHIIGKMNTFVHQSKDCINGADKTLNAWSVRESSASTRQARTKLNTSATYGGSLLNGKDKTISHRKAIPSYFTHIPNNEDTEELANACVRMFGSNELPIVVKKKCADKIEKAQGVGISKEEIALDIEDAVKYGREPLALFCGRMNQKINRYIEGTDPKTMKARERQLLGLR